MIYSCPCSLSIFHKHFYEPTITGPQKYPDSKVHGANMGPTWVLSATDGPHVGSTNLATRVYVCMTGDGAVKQYVLYISCVCVYLCYMSVYTLRWRHDDRYGVTNHQPHHCLLNRLFRRRSKKTSKLRVTGLCGGIHRGPVNSPHKWPVTRKIYPFDDVIMACQQHKWCDSPYRKRKPHRLIFYMKMGHEMMIFCKSFWAFKLYKRQLSEFSLIYIIRSSLFGVKFLS